MTADAGTAWLLAGSRERAEVTAEEISAVLGSLDDLGESEPPSLGELELLADAEKIQQRKPMTFAEAAWELGADPRAALAARTTQQFRPGSRQALRWAEERLGIVEYDPERRDWIANVWPVLITGQCRTMRARSRIVALLQEFMTDTEDDIPAWISQSVGRLLEHDSRQCYRDIPAGTDQEIYDRLVAAYRAAQTEGEAA